MTPQLARLMFPMILGHLIRVHMTNMVLPFAIVHTVTSSYLTTLNDVLSPQGSAP